MTGRMVDRASGNRRVRNSVEACLYIFEICEEAWRELVVWREEIEVRSWEEVRVSLVGERVVAMEAEEVILSCSMALL